MKNERIERLNYIVNNIKRLTIPEKRNILRLIYFDIGGNEIFDCADGSRVVINNVSDATVDAILSIMSHLE